MPKFKFFLCIVHDMIRVNLSHIKIWPPYFHSRLCNYVFSHSVRSIDHPIEMVSFKQPDVYKYLKASIKTLRIAQNSTTSTSHCFYRALYTWNEILKRFVSKLIVIDMYNCDWNIFLFTSHSGAWCSKRKFSCL
jgi:hypothetical protein